MNKQTFHSVLETVSVGDIIGVKFFEPYAYLSGDNYRVTVSKVGRGRGGSRVIEVVNARDGSNSISGLDVDGVYKSLGTAVSELVSSITVAGVVHETSPGDEPRSANSPAKRGRPPKFGTTAKAAKDANDRSRADAKDKVVQALSATLASDPKACFKFIGKTASSELNGEWATVAHQMSDDGRLLIEFIGREDSERKLSFDSAVHGPDIKDILLIELV